MMGWVMMRRKQERQLASNTRFDQVIRVERFRSTSLVAAMASQSSADGTLKVEYHLNDANRAPLGKIHETVLVQLTAPTDGAQDQKVPLDLVAVLDISGSMNEGGRLEVMKKAMDFVIDNIGKKNRLAIVTFADKAIQRSKLRMAIPQVKDKSKEIIRSLVAKGETNMSDGLQAAIELIKEDHAEKTKNNTTVILLMSDGHQNHGSNAAAVDIPPGIAVDTFGFEAGHDHKLLKKIAKKSYGGMYHPVHDTKDRALKNAFSQFLGGYKYAVIKGLELTLMHPPSINLEAKLGAYQADVNNRSVTFKIGDLFGGESRRIWVTVDLPATTNEGDRRVGNIKWNYQHMPEEKTSKGELPIVIKRSSAATAIGQRSKKIMRSSAPEMIAAAAEPYMKKQVRTEVVRHAHFCTLKEVKALAKEKQLEAAQDKVAQARNDLDDILEARVDLCRETMKFLYTELQELLDLMDTQEMCDKHGLAYARAAVLSHGRQRFAARGDVHNVRLFATPRMGKYLQKATN